MHLVTFIAMTCFCFCVLLMACDLSSALRL